MSRKYVCDCCGTDLNDFDDKYVMHVSYDGKTRDFCPSCSDGIEADIKSFISYRRYRLSSGRIGFADELLEEITRTNNKHRISNCWG